MHFIQTQIENRIGYLTLNRAERRNALSGALVTEMRSALSLLENSDAVKVIVLKANGPVFSAGADLDYLKQLQNNTFDENYADSSALAHLFQSIYECKKVIISQIQGHAIAGGCGLATVTDFSFAVPEAQFGYTEVKIGFIPAIVSIFLTRKIGEGKARDLLLTGRLIDANSAQQMGLINEVVDAALLETTVRNFAEKLSLEASGNSLALTKNLLARVQEMTVAEGLDFAARQNAQCRAEKDCRKGIAAFLAKEKISW
ncbi:MAG: enoyl-CoA hydratase-related protein [Chitinophagales bacterium]